MYPIVIHDNGTTVFLHAYYNANRLAEEAMAILNDDAYAIVAVRDADGITVDGLTLVAKGNPLTYSQLEEWAVAYERRRNE